MTPIVVWDSQKEKAVYLPEAWDQDGFIHCTDDLDELLAVGNRYYLDDTRSWLAVHIDCDRLHVPVVYEDAGHRFPHIYGELPLDSVIETMPLIRDALGTFVAFGGRRGTD